MPTSRFSQILRVARALGAITFSLAVSVHAQTFTTLVNFTGGNGAAPSYGPLIQGTNGNVYGSTQQGGKHSGGVVFEVTPDGKLTDIYSFCSVSKCADGESPWATPVLGTDGNLYGTTNLGGNLSSDNFSGSGTVYKLTTGGKLTRLYSFCPIRGCKDGKYPVGLMQASNGNFYGATGTAGLHNNGNLFEISNAGKFKVLYSFCSLANCADGAVPYSAPMQGSNGNLYGTTYLGGAYLGGVVYEITPAGQYKVIYNFCAQTDCTDGNEPLATLVEDASGNFYGTTFYGGAYSYGTVFEITANHTYKVLHSFDGTDGQDPIAELTLADDGNLYGMTPYSAVAGGTIFEITPAGEFTSLYSFCTGSSCTGSFPVGALLEGANGNLYGATEQGGTENDGTVFSFSAGLSPRVK